MRQWWQRSSVLCGATFVAVLSLLSIDVRGQAGKRPLTYDVYDAWKTIQGTTLSRDGVWLAYATSAQGVDGELVVRNLQSGQEYRHPRGTSPQITPDGKFVVFTIAQSKADEERQREQERRAGARGQARGGGGENQGDGARAPVRTSAGIMALATGQVTTVERVGSVRLPDESSTWVALYRGAGGAGRGGGRGGGRAGGRAGGPPVPPPATPAANTPSANPAPAPAAQTGQGTAPAGRGAQGQQAEAEPREGATGARARRKDPGSDLILRNLVTGQDITIPLVSDFEWNRDGSWLAYGVSSAKAEEDGAFARQMSDGSLRTLLKGKGNYKTFGFDEDGKQLAFLSDQADYDKDAAPYRLYYWKGSDAAAVELASATTRGMTAGMVVSDQGALSFSKDGQRLYLGTAPAPTPPAPDGAPEPRGVDLWHWKDPLLQPMQRVRAQQERNRSYRAVVHLADKRFVQLADPGDAGDPAGRRSGSCARHRRSAVPAGSVVGYPTTATSTWSNQKTAQRKKINEHFRTGAPMTMSPGGKFLLYFDESQNDWFTDGVADGARVNLTEKLGQQLLARGLRPADDCRRPTGRPGGRPTTFGACSTTSTTSGRLAADGSDARMVTKARSGARGAIGFRDRALDADDEPGDPPRRQAVAALRQRRPHRGQRLLPRRLTGRRRRKSCHGAEGRRTDRPRRRTPTGSS